MASLRGPGKKGSSRELVMMDGPHKRERREVTKSTDYIETSTQPTSRRVGRCCVDSAEEKRGGGGGGEKKRRPRAALAGTN
jgi:hypothetical protein